MFVEKMHIPKGKTIPYEYVRKDGTHVSSTITRRSGVAVPVEFIVVHNNGNEASTLMNERKWLENPNNVKATSWNLMIKENSGIEAIPWGEAAYHAGNWNANHKSYGIELHAGGNFAVTLQNAVIFIADKLKNVMGVHPDDVLKYVKPHRAFTKTECPALIKEGVEWYGFISRIQNRMRGIDEMTPIIKFQEVLQIGMHSQDVKLMQKILNMDGFDLEVDGAFGNGTLKAVKQFQSNYKLKPDGFVGTATQKMLNFVANRPYEIRYFDHQTQYVVIPKRKVAQIKTLKAQGSRLFPVQTTKTIERQDNPDIIVNGGFFDMATGAPCHYFIHEGKRVNYNAYSPHALIVHNDGRVKFEDSRKATEVRYGMSFAPVMFFEGKKIMDITGLNPSFLSGLAPKHTFMETENYYVEIAVDGRAPIHNYTGRNTYQMADLCVAIANRLGSTEKVINAGEYDGGASISIRCNGREITRSYKYPRAVPNAIGYYFIK